MTTMTTTNGSPVGVIGFGRFTAEERVAFAAGDAVFTAKVEAAVKAVPPALTVEEMYAALWAAE